MKIKVKDNTKQYIRELKKHHGGLSLVSAETVNTAAKLVERTYKRKLDSFTLRNQFTKGAVQVFKARPTRSKGGFRNIKDINAIVGVKKLRGGKEHYLNKQEIGDIKMGYSKTKRRVAIPLDVARSGGSHTKPIQGALRLQKSTIQTLHIAGQPLGVPESKWQGKQSWGILYKYMNKENRYGWDRAKQFFFTGLKKGLGVFRKIGKKISMTRLLEKKAVRIKALHKFDRSFDKLSPRMMKNIFFRNADRFLRGK